MKLPEYLEFSPQNWGALATVATTHCDGNLDYAYARLLAEVPWDTLAAQENGDAPEIPREAKERMETMGKNINQSWNNPALPRPGVVRWLYWDNWARAVRLVFDEAEWDTPGEYGTNTMPFVRELLDEAAAWRGHFGPEVARIAAPRFFMMAALDFLLRHGANAGMAGKAIGDDYGRNRRLHDRAISRYTGEIQYELGKAVGRGGQWWADEARVANAEARTAEAEEGRATAEADMYQERGKAEEARLARERAERAGKRKAAELKREVEARATAEGRVMELEKQLAEARAGGNASKNGAKKGRRKNIPKAVKEIVGRFIEEECGGNVLGEGWEQAFDRFSKWQHCNAAALKWAGSPTALKLVAEAWRTDGYRGLRRQKK